MAPALQLCIICSVCDDQHDDFSMQDDDIGHDMIQAPSVAVPM